MTTPVTEQSERPGKSDGIEDAPRLLDVVRALEQLYPLQFAEEWDHPGLIVGDPTDRVRTIAFAVDPTMAVVDEALRAGTDLLICHHPLLFRSVHEVSGLGVHGAIVGKLYRAHCALWVGHTNADVAYRGVGQAAADAFGLLDQKPLVSQGECNGHEVGLGRVGWLPEPVKLRNFARVVANALPNTPYGIQVAGNLDGLVKSVAVLPGSGDSNFEDARASGADVYVTSDLRHHPATDALEQARYEAALRSTQLQRAGVETTGDDDLASTSEGASPETIRPALINTPHSAIESLWFRYAAVDVPAAVQVRTGYRPKTAVIHRLTDPWQMVLPGLMEE